MRIEDKTVLSIMAHPDDAEFLCTGTMALLLDRGWNIVIASMTPGQAGSDSLNATEISKIRRMEAIRSAEILNGIYRCLECEDIFLFYDRPNLIKVVELIREVKPQIIITNSPSDYMIDHEVTSHLVQTACLASEIPNVYTNNSIPLDFIPYLYYSEATMGIDKFGQEVKSTMYVDVSSKIDIKCKMLHCHKSQSQWLQKISKIDNYIDTMKSFNHSSGQKINTLYAEGFRQHLGYSYPRENILAHELRDLLYISF